MASLSGASDAELLISMKGGDKSAYNEIYERYWKKLYNETFKRLKNTALVEEIVQDVFIDLWVKRERKQIEHLYRYLIIAVRYTVYTNYRRTKSLPYFEEPLEHMALSDLEADSLLNVKELRACISLWMTMQPEKRAEIFRLKYMEDFSTREISEMLGISQKTVQNQLITSFTSLRDFLKKLMILLTLI
jgi:RNA polymerase sigma factor (sigma-70 family)